MSDKHFCKVVVFDDKALLKHKSGNTIEAKILGRTSGAIYLDRMAHDSNTESDAYYFSGAISTILTPIATTQENIPI